MPALCIVSITLKGLEGAVIVACEALTDPGMLLCPEPNPIPLPDYRIFLHVERGSKTIDL